MPTVLFLSAAALALLSLSLVLWHRARHGSRQQASTRHMDEQLRLRTVHAVLAREERVQALQPWHGAPGGWGNLLLRAGIRPGRHFHLTLAVRILALPIALLPFFGLTAAGATLAVTIPLNLFHLWLKASRRHDRIIRQLPDFLESMVRLMAVGSSLGAAFQGAADRTEAPLRDILDQALHAGRIGVELDVALRQTARLHGVYELYLAAAIIGVAIRIGGRTDHVLERMAAFMRDLTQARSELVALSAETRLSAWILALLPLGIGAMIIITNESLLTGMWQDPMGRKLLFGAVFLQVLGSFWLYRLSKLK